MVIELSKYMFIRSNSAELVGGVRITVTELLKALLWVHEGPLGPNFQFWKGSVEIFIGSP